LLEGLKASVLQDQFAEENIRAPQSIRTNLQLEVARLVQFDRYAKLKPDDLAVEEKRIEDEAVALEKEILKMDGTITSASLVANALTLPVKLTPEERAAAQAAQEKPRSATQPLLSQIRQSLAQSLGKKTESKSSAPGKKETKNKLKLEALPAREVSLAVLKKQIHPIYLPAGAPIYAVRGGQVLYAGDFRGLGKAVVIAHDKDICTIYGYLNTTDVITNATVAQGQKIGSAGAFYGQPRTGVQFEVRKAGEVTDLSAVGIKAGELEAAISGKK